MTKIEKLSEDQRQLVLEVYQANPPMTIVQVGSLLRPMGEFIDFAWPPGAAVNNGFSRSTPIATVTAHAVSELKRVGMA